MLYALTRQDGTIAVTTIMPKEITTDGRTLPVYFVNGSEKYLTAIDGLEELRFDLPSDDMRTYEADSIPDAVLGFYDVAKVIEDYPDPIVSYEKITVDDLPDSRTYRDAWAVSGKTIVHDMPRAREIHRTHLRQDRKPKLEALDILYQRADEQDDGPRKRSIAAEKQRLRDITSNPRIEQALTVEALKALTVEFLLEHP